VFTAFPVLPAVAPIPEVIPSPTKPLTELDELAAPPLTFCSGCTAGVTVPLSGSCMGVPSSGELGVAIGCELALAEVEAETDVEVGTVAGVERPDTAGEGSV
jgi:hypothetical protein